MRKFLALFVALFVYMGALFAPAMGASLLKGQSDSPSSTTEVTGKKQKKKCKKLKKKIKKAKGKKAKKKAKKKYNKKCKCKKLKKKAKKAKSPKKRKKAQRKYAKKCKGKGGGGTGGGGTGGGGGGGTGGGGTGGGGTGGGGTGGGGTGTGVPTALYLHGSLPFGEFESDPAVNNAYLPMDSKEPTESQFKSKQITTLGATPNTACAGNNLFPVWTGSLSGRVVGDLAVEFTTIATPGASVRVDVYADVASLMCNEEEPTASATAVVPLAPAQGVNKVTIPNVDFTAQSTLMFQIVPVHIPPFFGRVLYDSTSAMSSLKFTCTPTTGTTCTP